MKTKTLAGIAGAVFAMSGSISTAGEQDKSLTSSFNMSADPATKTFSVDVTAQACTRDNYLAEIHIRTANMPYVENGGEALTREKLDTIEKAYDLTLRDFVDESAQIFTSQLSARDLRHFEGIKMHEAMDTIENMSILARYRISNAIGTLIDYTEDNQADLERRGLAFENITLDLMRPHLSGHFNSMDDFAPMIISSDMDVNFSISPARAPQCR